MLTAGRIVVLLLTILFFSLFNYELALGQGQSQQKSSLTYKNPNLGVSINYPSDWRLLEKSNGIFIHSWAISGNAITGTFKVHVDVSADGKSGSKEESFQVIANDLSQGIRPISTGECSNNPGSAGMGFPHEKKTECQLEDWNECKNSGEKWDDRCKDLNERFFDDCEGFANKEECDAAWEVPPVCDVDTPPGESCRDEGDEDNDPNDIYCPEAGPKECPPEEEFIVCPNSGCEEGPNDRPIRVNPDENEERFD